MIRAITASETGLPLGALVDLLRAAHETHPDPRQLGLAPVHEYCAQGLADLLLGPVRDEQDWSIDVSRICRCRLCGALAEFLRASNQRQREWPLAKNERSHVHGVIDAYAFPVTHVTRRQGRPFTLVLTKTDALFDREAAERARWDRDVKWLTRTARAF